MSYKRTRSCFNKKFRVVVALTLVLGTLLGIVGGAAVTAFAASFPTVEYVGSDITKVTDLNSGVSKCSIDLGDALYEPGSCIAVPIDLSKYGTGTVQLRWYSTSAVQDQFSMYIVEEDDLFTAKNISGIVQVTYGTVTRGNKVQGVQRVDDGLITWNVPLEGRKTYYLVISNLRTSESNYIKYGWGDITLDMVYKSSNANSSEFLQLDNGVVYKNFISLTNSEIKHYIAVDKASVATLYFTFDGETAAKTGTGMIAIYNQYGEKITEKTVEAYGANTRTEFKLSLDSDEAQTYTVTLSGIQGATTLRVEKNATVLDVTQGTTEVTAKDTVYINTNGIDVSTIQYVKKDVADNLIGNASSWTGAIQVQDAMFEVTENGTYTIRVYGANGKYYYSKINITNIDNKAPDFNEMKRASNTAIKINVIDEKLKYITLNGRKCLNGAYINEEGIHNLQAADYAGNIVNTSIYVDRSAPYIRSNVIYDGAQLGVGYYSFEVGDAISGIDFVMIDGVRQDGYGNKYSINVSYSHEILIVDLCGNETTIRVTLKTVDGSSVSGGSTSGGNGGGFIN